MIAGHRPLNAADCRLGGTGLPRYNGCMSAKPVLTLEQVAEGLRGAPPATRDDVPVDLEGRRLDSPEKVLAWVAEVNAARAAENGAGRA